MKERGKVKVIISNDQKVHKIPTGIHLLVRQCCIAVLTMEKLFSPAEISVRFVNDEIIHELNKEFRNVDNSTDVLSFPLGENGEYDINNDTGAKMLGDIIISVETALKQSKEYGHTFQTRCDTEVVLRAYIQWGEECLQLFNGIFSFAVWDGRRLFLARDRIGVKPLFYKEHGGGLIFGSEIKNILA